MSIGSVIAGNKTQFLVLKFISNLKRAVKRTKLETDQDQNEFFIKKVLKKNIFQE